MHVVRTLITTCTLKSTLKWIRMNQVVKIQYCWLIYIQNFMSGYEYRKTAHCWSLLHTYVWICVFFFFLYMRFYFCVHKKFDSFIFKISWLVMSIEKRLIADLCYIHMYEYSFFSYIWDFISAYIKNLIVKHHWKVFIIEIIVYCFGFLSAVFLLISLEGI